MKVCFLPSDIDGPGSYRALFPASELEKRGHQIFFPPYAVKDGEIVFGPYVQDADLYVIQRRLDDFLPEKVTELRKMGKRVVIEADDDDFALPSWHNAYKHLTPKRKRTLIELARSADAVTVSTPALERRYRQFNRNTFLLPNYLNWEMWEHVAPVYQERPWEKLRIGWYGQYDLRVGDCRVLQGTIGPWLKEHPEVEFAIGGNGAENAFSDMGVPESQRVYLPTLPFREHRLHEMLQFDIGLIPLERHAFNEAKSHLKGMEMNARGIPFVATPTESYKDWLSRGGAGVLAGRPRDWRGALDRLLDPGYRSELAKHARTVASRNTIQEHVVRWEDAYTSVAHLTSFTPATSTSSAAARRARTTSSSRSTPTSSRPAISADLSSLLQSEASYLRPAASSTRSSRTKATRTPSRPFSGPSPTS